MNNDRFFQPLEVRELFSAGAGPEDVALNNAHFLGNGFDMKLKLTDNPAAPIAARFVGLSAFQGSENFWVPGDVKSGKKSPFNFSMQIGSEMPDGRVGTATVTLTGTFGVGNKTVNGQLTVANSFDKKPVKQKFSAKLVESPPAATVFNPEGTFRGLLPKLVKKGLQPIPATQLTFHVGRAETPTLSGLDLTLTLTGDAYLIDKAVNERLTHFGRVMSTSNAAKGIWYVGFNETLGYGLESTTAGLFEFMYTGSNTIKATVYYFAPSGTTGTYGKVTGTFVRVA